MQNDGPFFWFMHKRTKVQARRVKAHKVIHTDRGKIVLEPGDFEILDEGGVTYANSPDQFERNYAPNDDRSRRHMEDGS
jgi:hypothetical protein